MPENDKFMIPEKIDYFLGLDEKVIYASKASFNNSLNGNLVLTDKKLFFYFDTNITKEKKFIATYPYLVSVNLKEGLFFSTLEIKTRKQSFLIGKINKKIAKKFHHLLSNIIKSIK